MTKADIIKEISHKTGIDKNTVETTVEAFITNVKTNVAEQKAITLRGFGNFTIRKRGAKIARNISKNEAIALPAQYVPVFKPSKLFKNRLKKVNPQ